MLLKGVQSRKAGVLPQRDFDLEEKGETRFDGP